MTDINIVVKLRKALLFIGFFILFIGGQLVVNEEGGVNTFFESFTMAIILFGLQYYLFSNHLYDSLRDDGININFKLYQIIGLITAIIACIIVYLAVYTGTLANS